MSTELSTPATSGIVSKTGIVLATMDEIWRFAETVIASGMAPKGINNPAAATIVIQLGMELGLPPMASLQNIAPINGRPSIWGDAMLGIVRATNELESFEEWFELNGNRVERTPTDYPDGLTAVCKVKRKGYDPSESSFSVADAKRAKLWQKQGPWTEYPSRMLKVRARGFSLRDAFGDALRGLYSAEELRDAPNEMRDVTPKHTDEAPPKVITGAGTPAATPAATTAPAKAPRQKSAPVENPTVEVPAENAEAAATETTEIPPRPKMVDAVRTAFRAAGFKTLPAAEECARKAGYLEAGVGFAALNDEAMFKIYQNVDTIFVAFPEAPESQAPTQGGEA